MLDHELNPAFGTKITDPRKVAGIDTTATTGPKCRKLTHEEVKAVYKDFAGDGIKFRDQSEAERFAVYASTLHRMLLVKFAEVNGLDYKDE